MSFWARGSPDSVQRRRLLMPQFFSTDRVKARSFSTVPAAAKAVIPPLAISPK